MKFEELERKSGFGIVNVNNEILKREKLNKKIQTIPNFD